MRLPSPSPQPAGSYAARLGRWAPSVAALLALLLACAAAGLASAQQPVAAAALPGFDFARAQSVLGWAAAHDVSGLAAGPEGLRIDIGGSDPYVVGPARDLPGGQPLWFTMRIKSESGGDGQLFYFTKGPNERDSVHYTCRPGVWEEVRVPLPALGPGTRFRLDPPGESGSCVVARMALHTRMLYAEPTWPAVEPPAPPNESLAIQSGDLRLVLATSQWNDFVLSVNGHPMAIGHSRPLIGVIDQGKLRWIEIGREVKGGKANLSGGEIVSTVTLAEPGGALWQIRQTYRASAVPGAIDLKTEVAVDQDRNVLYLPMLMLLPGAGSFGASKDHGLFAGLEYLDANEPSSSEADIVGAGSQRQTPDSERITLPLMAIQKDGRYIGLSWQPDPAFCALFDSPDRHFGSGGHAMGILYPGSDGSNRAEGSYLPYAPQLLRAGQTLTLNATLLGGMGESVVPAVQAYVALRGAAPLPRTGLSLQKYVDLAAAGWLDSGDGEAGRYRHALPGAFKPQPAADAAVDLQWLSDRTENEALATRLRAASRNAQAQVQPGDENFAAVGHIRYPLPALLYGHAIENAERALAEGRDLLRRFQPDGTVPYLPKPQGPDLARTHFARDANGLTAEAVTRLLESAAVSGDAELTRMGLKYLGGLDRFAGSAPRGAQTWEVPLHTPDILASANLVRAYTLGYALSGDAHYLDQAKYWAWTGIPFVNLSVPLTEPARPDSGGPVRAALRGTATDPVGVYATTAVYGASQWVAPNWMGRPVQWCGLVYADALYRLAKYDPSPVWKAVADGITVSGMQQCWPRGGDRTRQGLLPDSFGLRAQNRFDPGINPATVEADAVQLLTGAPLYDMQTLHANGLIVIHAPGRIKDTKEEAGRAVFTIDGWPRGLYDVLVVGLKRQPRVSVDGKPVELSGENRFSAETGRLVVHVAGKPRIALEL